MNAWPDDHNQYLKGNYANSLFFAPVSSALDENSSQNTWAGRFRNSNASEVVLQSQIILCNPSVTSLFVVELFNENSWWNTSEHRYCLLLIKLPLIAPANSQAQCQTLEQSLNKLCSGAHCGLYYIIGTFLHLVRLLFIFIALFPRLQLLQAHFMSSH